MQERLATKRVHNHLAHDTLIKTSQAVIHLYYSDKPDRPYLLLLHGVGVDAKTNWYKQVKQLSKHFNLILPDLIFYGQSTSQAGDYSVEFQAAQIDEALSALPVKTPLNIMGFSYGALVAAVYNQLYNHKVNKLVIADGPVKFFSIAMADSMARLAGTQSIANILAPQSLADFEAMEKAVLSRRFLLSGRFKKKLMKYYFGPTLADRRRQIDYLAGHQATYQGYDYNLDKVSTLLIWGKKDGVVPLQVGEQLHAAYPTTTRLLVFKKARHDVHFRNARALNKTVIHFFKN